MSLPVCSDILNFLEGYCLNLEGTYSYTGNTTLDSPVITNMSSTSGLKPKQRISGAGIPTGAEILTVDSSTQITLDTNATATASDIALTITYYSVISCDWISKRMSNFVIPYVERVVGYSIQSIEEVTRYYSGNGGSLLILNERPVIEVTNITYTNIPSELQTGNLLLAVELIPEEGILKAKSTFNEGNVDPIFPRGVNNIKITYKRGLNALEDENSVEAIDLKEAIIYMTAKQTLVFIGARTGGGSISGQSWSRQFGNRGKYTDIINELDVMAYNILRKYTSGVVGA